MEIKMAENSRLIAEDLISLTVSFIWTPQATENKRTWGENKNKKHKPFKTQGPF